ncbi:hypothetical protein EO244_08605 [Ancylomarina salipaludis]|uniref:STAS/SEC14 domain-containing protein n=1 Tax=Ancylomarina salipaludis TaxID=2501299 RepID=A0A4Q1JN31_9BACT|nr:hypothetical protein [Ancylomarina salipaludis]RXQ95099.1 hypothetical protein EO244_08605 [Ancylomarina salipaludis]
MSENFKFEFDTETSILYKHYYGLISVEDITSSWEQAINNKLIPHNVKGFILDFRKSGFDFEVGRYIEISNFYRKYIHVFGGLKIALITIDPKDLVIPVLFKAKQEGYESRPFSTTEAAKEWVLS